jgi:O-succinylbenzoic acid--CoA ligase
MGGGLAMSVEVELERAWRRGQLVALPAPSARERQALAAAIGPAGLAPFEGEWGPGVVVASGGSLGRRRWCLQPLAHLEASALATGRWLQGLGLDPAACEHLNPLPLHHVSGLLPLVRCRLWGARHRRLEPAWLRDPARLAEAVVLPSERPGLLSLVPTQLQRLLAVPAAEDWLRRLAVIWVGGAPLAEDLARRARAAGLPLAPCYGATETAAMVTALAPRRFLVGQRGCGDPLPDVELRIEPASGAVQLRSDRLTPGWLEGGRLCPLPRTQDGWWCSGDAGRLGPGGLELVGRLDGAIHSGGETVFPEELERRLRTAAAPLPLQALLLLAVEDPQWGQRLEALVRPLEGADAAALLVGLRRICDEWTPAERPRAWWICPDLAPTSMGKWQRGRWRSRLQALQAGETLPPAPADGDPQRQRDR